jgi:hypothetical protein
MADLLSGMIGHPRARHCGWLSRASVLREFLGTIAGVYQPSECSAGKAVSTYGDVTQIAVDIATRPRLINALDRQPLR